MHEECYTYVYISNSGICSMWYIYVNTYILHLLGLVKALYDYIYRLWSVVFLKAVVSELSCVLSSDDRGMAADRSVVMPCHCMTCLINKWNGILSDILANQRASIAREHQNPFFPVNSYFFYQDSAMYDFISRLSISNTNSPSAIRDISRVDPIYLKITINCACLKVSGLWWILERYKK